MIRSSVSMAEWRSTIEQGRAPLQPVGERRLLTASHTTDFTGSPAVQLVFGIASPGNPHATETLVLSRSPDGWRIAAIGIRRADTGRAATSPAASGTAPAWYEAVTPPRRARPKFRTSGRASPASPC